MTTDFTENDGKGIDVGLVFGPRAGKGFRLTSYENREI